MPSTSSSWYDIMCSIDKIKEYGCCNYDCQWLASGRSFSPGFPVSSINKTDRQDINEILLKVALNTITLILTHNVSNPLDPEIIPGCIKYYLYMKWAQKRVHEFTLLRKCNFPFNNEYWYTQKLNALTVEKIFTSNNKTRVFFQTFYSNHIFCKLYTILTMFNKHCWY